MPHTKSSWKRTTDLQVEDQPLRDLAKREQLQALIVVSRFFACGVVDEIVAAWWVPKQTFEHQGAMVRTWLRQRLMAY